MAKINYYLDTRRAKDGKPAPLQLSLYMRGARKYISTGLSVLPADWDAERNAPNEKTRYGQRLAVVTGRMMADARQLLLDMSGESINDIACAIAAAINPDYRPAEPKKRAEVLETVRHFCGLKRAQTTRSLYCTLARRIEQYSPTASFADITRGWLEAFDLYLSRTCKSVNGRAVYMRSLRAVVNYAIDEGITDVYAFRRYRIRTEKTAKRNMPVDDLRRLLTMAVEPWQAQYRDFFALSFLLIGINAKDLLLLPGGADALGRIEFNRAKTGRLYSIRVEPEAQAIIDRYRGSGHMLAVMDGRMEGHEGFLRRCNHALRTLGQTFPAGLPPEGEPLWPQLTTYWARHSWATIAASLDIPKDTIAAALGHGAQSVTDIYIDFDRSKIDAANRAVIDWVMYGKR